MRILYILVFIFFSTVQAKSQSARPVAELVSRVVKFYPNPAVSQITFDFDQSYNKSYSLQVYNFVGKKVLDIPSINLRETINVTDYYRGVYIFQIKDKSGKTIETGKFQVSH